MSETTFPKWLWYEFLRVIVRLASILVFQVRYTGQRNIPKHGGVLMVSNHQSHLDPPLVGAGCPRHMRFLARNSLFRFKPFALLINSLNAIPIDREGIGLAGVKETLRQLKQGRMVLVFPEATRTRDGEIGRMKPGFGSMALRGNASILPVVIEGAYDVWPRHKKYPGLGVVHVHYGPPIPPEQIAELGERELVEEVQRRLRECQAMVRRRPIIAERVARRRARRAR
jgi:1-acyl-sn-glycerol-3-phosphate acyltransferase